VVIAAKRAGLLAALDVVAADICGPRWREEAEAQIASNLDSRARVRTDVRERIAARRQAEAAAAPARVACDQAALDALLSHATRGRGAAVGHNAICARIDAGALRAKYGDRPVFPPEWDERRPKAGPGWPEEEAADAK
jgi:hypothetical protein